MNIALYQPEIAQNAGTIMRLCACLGVTLDIIEPCGFIWNHKQLARSAMDYAQHLNVKRHPSWKSFLDCYPDRNLVLLTPHTERSYIDHRFSANDILLFGRESDGVPDSVFSATHHHLKIPMQPACRSLNVAVSAGIVAGEAARQLNLY